MTYDPISFQRYMNNGKLHVNANLKRIQVSIVVRHRAFTLSNVHICTANK